MRGWFAPVAVADGWFGEVIQPEGWFNRTFLDESGAVVFSPADALHGHSADAVSFTVNYSFAAADALHGHTADNVVVIARYVFTPGDATHGHSADSPAVSFSAGTFTITPADALHGQTADVVSLAFTPSEGATPRTSSLVLYPLSRIAAPIDLGRTLKLVDAGRVVTPVSFSRVIKPFAQARFILFRGDEMSDKFPEPFDPADRQLYTFDLTNVLDASENIATATLAASEGLTIGGSGYETVVGTKTVGFWLQADDATMLPQDKQVTLTVTTNSNPARRLQRTGIIEVRQR